MKKFTIFLAFIFSILSLGNLQANSNIGHNTIGIYCIWKMSTDNSFMPQIQGLDREELTNPPILKCSTWEDFSDAQKAFLQGVNFPDNLSLMEVSHNKAPLEVLAAMYILKDFCPAVYEDKPEEVKAFICRMQKYMTWGTKLHIEMDKIVHAKLPYAEKALASHIWIEKNWDQQLRSSIAMKLINYGIDWNNFEKATEVFGPFASQNYKFNNHSLDIRDDYVDLVLDFYNHGKDLKTNYSGIWENRKKAIDAASAEVLKFSKFPLPSNYQYPQLLAESMIYLLSSLDLTIPPTREDIERQYNIDLPMEMQNGNFLLGPTPEGQKMLKKVQELGRDNVFQILKLNGSSNTDTYKENIINQVNALLICAADYRSGSLFENEKKYFEAIDNLVNEITREPNWSKLLLTNYNKLSEFLFEEQSDIKTLEVLNNNEIQGNTGSGMHDMDDKEIKTKANTFALWSIISPYITEADFNSLKADNAKIKPILASCIEKFKREQLVLSRINIISHDPLNLSTEEKTFLRMLHISGVFVKLCTALDNEGEQVLKHDTLGELCKSDANVEYLLKMLEDPNWLGDGGPFQIMLMENLASEVAALQGVYEANNEGKIPGGTKLLGVSLNVDEINQGLEKLKKGIPSQIVAELGLNKKEQVEVFDSFNKSSVQDLLKENKLEMIPYVDYIPEGVDNPNYFLRFKYDPPLIKKDKLYRIYLREGEDESTAVTKVSFQLVYRYPERSGAEVKSETTKESSAEETPTLHANEQVFSLGLIDKNVVPDEVTGYPIKKNARVTMTQFIQEDVLKFLFMNFGFPDYLRISAKPKSDNLLNITYSIDKFQCEGVLKNLNKQTSIQFVFDIDELTKISRKDTDPEFDFQPLLGKLKIFDYNGEKCDASTILEIIKTEMNESLKKNPPRIILPLDAGTNECTEILEITKWGEYYPELKIRKNVLGIPVVLECALKYSAQGKFWNLTINEEDTKDILSQKLEELIAININDLFKNFLPDKNGVQITIDDVDFNLSEQKISGKFLVDLKEAGHTSVKFTWDIKNNNFDEETQINLVGLFLSLNSDGLNLQARLQNILNGLPIKVQDLSLESKKIDANNRDVSIQFNLNVNENELILNKLKMTGKIGVHNLLSRKFDFSDVDFDFSQVSMGGSFKTLLSKFISQNSCISFSDPYFIKEGIQFNVTARFPFLNNKECTFCQVTITKDGLKLDSDGELIENFLNSKINDFMKNYPHVCHEGHFYLDPSTFDDTNSNAKGAIEIVLVKDKNNNIQWPVKFQNIYVYAKFNDRYEKFDILDPAGCAFQFASEAIDKVQEKILAEFEKILEPLKDLLHADRIEIVTSKDRTNAAMISLSWEGGYTKQVLLSMMVTAGVTCKDNAISLEKPHFSDFKLEDPQNFLSGKLNEILPTDFFKIDTVAIRDHKLVIPFVFKNEEITNGKEIRVGTFFLTFEGNKPKFCFEGNPGDVVEGLKTCVQNTVLEFLKRNSLDKFGPISVTGISPDFKWENNKLSVKGFGINGNICYSCYSLPCSLTWSNKKFHLNVRNDDLTSCFKGILEKIIGSKIEHQPIEGDYKKGISITVKGNYEILKKEFGIEIRNLCLRPNSLQFPELINFTIPISNLNIPVGSVNLVLYEMTISANFTDQSKFSSLRVGVGAAMTVYHESVGKTLKFNSQIQIPFNSPLEVQLTANLVLLNKLQIVSGEGDMNLKNFYFHLDATIGGCFGNFFSGKAMLDLKIQDGKFRLDIKSSLHAVGHEFGELTVNMLIDMKNLTNSMFECEFHVDFRFIQADMKVYIPLNLKDLKMNTSFDVQVGDFSLTSVYLHIGLRRLECGTEVLGIGFSIKLRKLENLTKERLLKKILSLFKFSFSLHHKHHADNPDYTEDEETETGSGTGIGGGKGTIPNTEVVPNGGQNGGSTSNETKGTEVKSNVPGIPAPSTGEEWKFDKSSHKFAVFEKGTENIRRSPIGYKIRDNLDQDFSPPQGATADLSFFRIQGEQICVTEVPYGEKLEGLPNLLVRVYIKDGAIYGKQWTDNGNGEWKDKEIECTSFNPQVPMQKSDLSFLKSGQGVDLSWATNLNNYLNVGAECAKTWENPDKGARKFARTSSIELMIAAKYLGVDVERVNDNPPLYTFTLGGKYFLVNNWDAIVIEKPYKDATNLQKNTWQEYLELSIDPGLISVFKDWLGEKENKRIAEFTFNEGVWDGAPAFGYIASRKTSDSDDTRKIITDKSEVVIDMKINSNDEYIAAACGYKAIKELNEQGITISTFTDSNNPPDRFAIIRDKDNQVISFFKKYKEAMKCIELNPPIEWNENNSCKRTLLEIFNRKYGNNDRKYGNNENVSAYRVEQNDCFKGGYVLVKLDSGNDCNYSFIADVEPGEAGKTGGTGETAPTYKSYKGQLPPQWSPFDDGKNMSQKKRHLLQIFQKDICNMEYLIDNGSFYSVVKWKEGKEEVQKFLIIKEKITAFPLKFYHTWQEKNKLQPQNQEEYYWKGFNGLDNTGNTSSTAFNIDENVTEIYLGKTNDFEGEVVRMVLVKKTEISLILSNQTQNCVLTISNDHLTKNFNSWRYKGKLDFSTYLKCLVRPDKEWKKFLPQSPTFFFRQTKEKVGANSL